MDFTKWVLAANLVALPIAFLLARKLLEGYAYRVSLGFSLFLLPVIISLLTAALTVSYQAVHAGLTDPAKSLRYE
jgi:putative ABC transport system permease protein